MQKNQKYSHALSQSADAFSSNDLDWKTATCFFSTSEIDRDVTTEHSPLRGIPRNKQGPTAHINEPDRDPILGPKLFFDTGHGLCISYWLTDHLSQSIRSDGATLGNVYGVVSASLRWAL